jgi:type II secretory ATPase GspE/PulE/Tfp pilus assembly ATPase PilB-like protein
LAGSRKRGNDCRGTGFRGRIGIFELLEMKTNISELILTRAADARFYEAARANGMVSLREECLTLVARGETTLASQYT